MIPFCRTSPTPPAWFGSGCSLRRKTRWRVCSLVKSQNQPRFSTATHRTARRQPTGVTFHTTKPLTPNAHANSPTNPTAHTRRPLKHLRQVSFSLSTPAQNAPETQTVIVHCRAKCTTNCSPDCSPQSFVECLDF